ncbi:MAG: hypothetical protein VCA34_10595, partial [Roseibacillus sp.]
MHKKRLTYIALMGVLGGLGLTACGEKKENATVPAGGGGDKKIAVKTPEGGDDPAPVSGGLEEVAKATGFAKFLPKSTHAYIGVFDGKGFVDGLRKSKLVKLIEEQAADVGGIDLDELEENPDAQMGLSLLAEEIFLAVGKGAPEQVANLMSINESSSRNMMKFMVEMVEAQITGKEPDGPGGIGGPESLILGAFLGDPSAGLVTLEKIQIPPLTIGFKVSDEDIRGQLLEMASGGLMQLLDQIGPNGQDIAEAVNVTRGDSKFTGLKITGKKVAGLITDEVREGMAEVMDAA